MKQCVNYVTLGPLLGLSFASGVFLVLRRVVSVLGSGRVFSYVFHPYLVLILSSAGFVYLSSPELVLGKSPSFSAQAAMECRQIKPLWDWSADRYGGKALPDPKSRSYAKKVAEQFLLKLDSNRSLLLASEGDGLTDNALKGWSLVLDRRNCEYFENFYSAVWKKAQGRTYAFLSKWKLKENAKTVASRHDDRSIEKELTRFESRPKTLAEMEKRLDTIFTEIVTHSDPKVIAAYRNDYRALVKDFIEEAFFTDYKLSNLPVLIAKSMLSAVDKYSTFMPQDEFEDFYQDLAGTVTGIGIRVAKTPGGFLIEKILSNSPAEKVLKAGDVIVQVEGESIADHTLESAKRLLKGAEGTWLRLGVRRENGKIDNLRVLRRTFSSEEVKVTSKWIKNFSTAPALLITVPSFYGRGGIDASKDEKSSWEDVEQIVKNLAKKKDKKAPIILDLRGNPGGYLEEAVEMAGLFLGNKVVTGVVEKKYRRTQRSNRIQPLYTGPLVIWLDEESASAAEVFAGALKDYGRALIVGTGGSYGKGSVQRLFRLQDDLLFFSEIQEAPPAGVVKLTTSYFFSPLGHNPSNGGVTPHVTMAKEEKVKRPDWETKPQVEDTESFLPDKETASLHKRDQRVQEIVHEILQREDEATAATLPSVSDEMAVARYGKLYAELQQSE